MCSTQSSGGPGRLLAQDLAQVMGGSSYRNMSGKGQHSQGGKGGKSSKSSVGKSSRGSDSQWGGWWQGRAWGNHGSSEGSKGGNGSPE